MDNILFETLDRYFAVLSKLGYHSYEDVYKMLFLVAIHDFIYSDFYGMITEDDYRDIEKALYCVFGSSCLVSFPSYCSSKRVMDKLQLGSITELANRVKYTEELFIAHRDKIDADFESFKDDITATEKEHESSVNARVSAFESSTNETIENHKTEVANDLSNIKAQSIVKTTSDVEKDIPDIVVS